MTDEREKYLREHGSALIKELFLEVDRLRANSEAIHHEWVQFDGQLVDDLRAELKRVVAKAEEDYARLAGIANNVIRERDQLKAENETLKAVLNCREISMRALDENSYCKPDCKASLELIDRLKSENERFLVEIDRLRAKICPESYHEVIGASAVSKELLQILKERDQLKAENETLRHEFKMAQASMPEVRKLRERVEKLRVAAIRVTNDFDLICEDSNRSVDSLIDALAADTKMEKEK